MHLSQIRLIVTDFAATARYYRDVIGLRPQVEPIQPPYIAFKPDEGSTLALHDRAALAAVLGPALRRDDRSLVSLRVDDLDEYVRAVTARGAALVAGPLAQSERVRAAYLRDPDGNLIEIQQWLVTQGLPSQE